jgi:hypothetical protein
MGIFGAPGAKLFRLSHKYTFSQEIISIIVILAVSYQLSAVSLQIIPKFGLQLSPSKTPNRTLF